MRDAPLVNGRFGESMMFIGRDGEPTLLLYRSPTYCAPTPVLSPDRSATPTPPPPSVVITDHAFNLHAPNPFDWRKGFYLGIFVLSVFMAWRCYRRWGNGGGDQGDGRQADAGLDSHGLADVLLAPTVAEYEGGKYILRPHNMVNLPTMTDMSGVDHKVKVGEVLFGPRAWERFDILVVRPRFPYGGMGENPTIFFLNPTVIQGGDAAGAQVVAPELSRSWIGDLIINQINEDLWLNEGLITYAKRRIVEVLQGQEGNGWRGLNRMERSTSNLEFIGMAGFDPDDRLLSRIEREIGLPAFVEFQKKLIAAYKFQSIDVVTFNELLKSNVPGVDDLDLWIPSHAVQPDSTANRKICTLAAEFKYGKIPSKDEVEDWGGPEWELYLANLCTDDISSQVTALDERYNLCKSPYYKVQVALLRVASPTGFRCCFSELDKCLKIVGRIKYLGLNRQ